MIFDWKNICKIIRFVFIPKPDPRNSVGKSSTLNSTKKKIFFYDYQYNYVGYVWKEYKTIVQVMSEKDAVDFLLLCKK